MASLLLRIIVFRVNVGYIFTSASVLPIFGHLDPDFTSWISSDDVTVDIVTDHLATLVIQIALDHSLQPAFELDELDISIIMPYDLSIGV